MQTANPHTRKNSKSWSNLTSRPIIKTSTAHSLCGLRPQRNTLLTRMAVGSMVPGLWGALVRPSPIFLLQTGGMISSRAGLKRSTQQRCPLIRYLLFFNLHRTIGSMYMNMIQAGQTIVPTTCSRHACITLSGLNGRGA